MGTLSEATAVVVELLSALPDDERIDALNEVRSALHAVSPWFSWTNPGPRQT